MNTTNIPTTEDTLLVNTLSHKNVSFDIAFDDGHLISDAGLTLTDRLISQLQLGPLLDNCVDLGDHPGAPNPGYKLLTIIQSLVAGGECIDDVDILRSGSTKRILSHSVAAPSTCGIHLRGYTFGHVRQLDKASGILLKRAWEAGAGPGDAPITVDVDSTITPVCGYKKEGASYGYTHEMGLHPLIATRAVAGEVLHIRERKGSANTQRGIRPFITETVSRIRNAGGSGQITFRADSGFYSEDTVAHCERKGLLYSITIQEYSTVKKVIEEIPEDTWVSIAYTSEGEAMVAETTYKGHRLIVRRTKLVEKQLEIWPNWRHHAFVTNRSGSAVELDQFHREHAQVELEIKECKEGAGLRHAPSGKYAANAAWVVLCSMAHNLMRWVQLLGNPQGSRIAPKTLRARFIAIAGRLVRHARTMTLHLPREWRWEKDFLEMHHRLSTLPVY